MLLFGIAYVGEGAFWIYPGAHEVYGGTHLAIRLSKLSYLLYFQVNGELRDVLIPWETATKLRRKRDRDEVLDCVSGYAIARIRELLTVGENEAPDDFLG